VQIDAEESRSDAGRCSRPGCTPPRSRSSQCCRSSWRSCTAPSRAGSPTTKLRARDRRPRQPAIRRSSFRSAHESRRARRATQPLRARVRSQAASRACVGLRTHVRRPWS
jgi:hypothetical protein